jgi:prepilin-type N-terminal cleavage/methylation domain-containing protein
VQSRRLLSRNEGLTLVEVLTAVSLLGIVTAVAATNFTAMRPAFRTRGAALAIAGDLNQARMSAVKEARVYEYLPVSGGYQIRRDDGAGGREVVKSVVLANSFPHVTFSTTAVTDNKDPYGADIASANAASTITFHSNGTVQNAAGVFVAASDSDEPIQQAVTLSAGGRVRIWKYGQDGWH